ncbi:hypothetical protein ACVW0B_000398 [Thermostichus sp. MS-CIW-23]|jgi:hypothetical protein
MVFMDSTTVGDTVSVFHPYRLTNWTDCLPPQAPQPKAPVLV